MVQSLPFPLVRLIDAVWYGEHLQEAVALWGGFRDELTGFLEREGDCFLSGEDELRFASIQHLLAALDDLAGSAQDARLGEEGLEELARLSLELMHQVHRCRADRQRQYFVPIRAVDLLLVAGVAAVQGRASAAAVQARLEPARQALAALQKESQARRQELPGEVSAALGNGFRLAGEGTERVDDWLRNGDHRDLEAGLHYLKGGAELVSHLVAERPVEGHPVSWVPVGGEHLAALVGRFEQLQAGLFRQTILVELEEFWRRARARVFLPVARRAAIVGRVDRRLRELRAVLGDTPEQEAVVLAASRLEQAFRQLTDEALPLERLIGSGLEPEARLLAAGWCGMMPDYLLAQAADAMAVPEALSLDLRERLRLFLENGDRLHLLAALEEMVGAVEDWPDEAGPSICFYCGFEIGVPEVRCPGCTATLTRANRRAGPGPGPPPGNDAG